MGEKMIKRARQFVRVLPHSQALGMTVDEVRPGWARMTMPYDQALVGDPESAVIFGGAISALLDTCCGLSVLVHPDAGVAMATLDLRIDYMRTATPGQAVRATAECYHVTRSVAFVRATASDDDPEHPVASATGAFSLDRGSVLS